MAKSGSFGTCQVCGARKGKGAMVAHLKGCLPVHFGTAPRVDSALLLLLRVQANGAPQFWLDVAVRPEAKLKDVDRLLRRTWLECCGHMSEFYGRAHRKVSMNAKAGEAFGTFAERLAYVYDFGSSTELVISVSDAAAGNFKNAVQLVARNEPPIWLCDTCGEAATAVCPQCLYEGKGFCCAAHVSTHDCGDAMLLPVVNSPRMGVCGYTGEALEQ
jgi:hypothetical protein